MADLPSTLAAIRERTGLKKVPAGRLIGLEHPVVWRWENSKARPSTAQLAAYLDALEATPDERRDAWAAFGIPESDLAEPPEAA